MKSYQLVLFVFFLLGYGATMTGFGITRNDEDRRALFRRITTNRTLNNTPIARHENCQSTCCARECLSNLICQSFSVNTNLKKCWLHDVDRNTKSESDVFVNKDGYSYYDTGFDLSNDAWRSKILFNIMCNKTCGSCPCIHVEEEGDICDCYYGGGQIKLGNLCWKPKDGCASSDGTNIILDDVCDDDPVYKFKYNAETGDLFHVCSNKRVCSINGWLGNGQPIVLGTCPKLSDLNKWFLTDAMYLYYGKLCIHTYYGVIRPGNFLVLWTGCGSYITLHRMQVQVPGKVLTEVWNSLTLRYSIAALTEDSRFPNSPDVTIWYHNLETPDFGQSWNYFGRRMRTKFTSPETGNHTFIMRCDDHCELFIGFNQSSKVLVVRGIYGMTSSLSFELEGGRKYYMEVLFVDMASADYLSVGVEFPSGKKALPITERYLTVP